jgi:hypothetical protein
VRGALPRGCGWAAGRRLLCFCPQCPLHLPDLGLLTILSPTAALQEADKGTKKGGSKKRRELEEEEEAPKEKRSRRKGESKEEEEEDQRHSVFSEQQLQRRQEARQEVKEAHKAMILASQGEGGLPWVLGCCLPPCSHALTPTQATWAPCGTF